MYGMVHRAVADYVVASRGETTWALALSRLGYPFDIQVAMQSYPDSLTYALVGKAAEACGAELPDFLRGLGRHFVGFAQQQGFAALLGGPGTDLGRFLQGLDSLHARISLSFPELQPPSFRCLTTGPGRAQLHYHSQRPGLLPFVLGLLEGLALHFRVVLQVLVVESRERGADHEVLQLDWIAA